MVRTEEVTYRDGPWASGFGLNREADRASGGRDIVLRDLMGKYNRGRHKRHRNSSSDLEDKVTQKAKRDRLTEMAEVSAESEVVPEAAVSQGPNAKLDPVVSQGLNEKLNDIIKSQERLRNDINANFVRQAAQLANMIDTKLAGLRQELDDKMRTITDDLREVQTRVAALEVRNDPVDAGDGAHIQEIDDIRRRLDTIEAGAATQTRSRDTLIVKGLEEATGKTADDLMTKCRQLLAQLQVTAGIIGAERMGTEGQGRRPRAVSMTFSSLDDVKEVMRSKRKLKDTQAYSTVYIEPQRSNEMRNLEANVRRLAKEHPTLEYHRGRLRNKTQAQQENGATGNR